MFRVIHVPKQPMVSERFQIQLPACNWGLLPIPSNLEGWKIFSMFLVANMTLPKGKLSTNTWQAMMWKIHNTKTLPYKSFGKSAPKTSRRVATLAISRFVKAVSPSDLSNSARPLTRPESNRAKSSNTCEAIQETIEANIDWWTVDKEKHGRSAGLNIQVVTVIDFNLIWGRIAKEQ